MRYFIAVTLALLGATAIAEEWEDRKQFAGQESGSFLRVLSSTDTALFAPIIEEFVTDNQNVQVEYFVTSTAEIDRRFRKSPSSYDVVISSAMDLQLKLVNDGFAQSVDEVTLPDWAHWRKSLLAFTSEPATIVVRKSAFEGGTIPQSRQELIQALRANPEVFEGRVGTYDVRQSGLGYLFATQDSRVSETFWRLMEVMGSLNVRLYCCSGQMIDDLSDGTIAVAYNVLGSYASARIDEDSDLAIILPSDFPITMMRTAMVSKETANAEVAEAFVRYLVDVQTNGSSIALPLPPISSEEDDAERATIALEPALLTFLDAFKRRKFISEWEDATIQR